MAAATTTTPNAQQPVSQAKDAVRKRRRRTAAGGAADDCFTCAKRNVKCDRRRPYCSQCLEVGNECSGYKTQLTWGVGVASRGKLRGLSLPIAKSPPVTSGGTTKKAGPPRSHSTSSTTGSQMAWPDVDDVTLSSRMSSHDEIDTSSDYTGSAPSTPFQGYEYDYLTSIPRPEGTPPLHQGNWSGVSFTGAATVPSGLAVDYRKLETSHMAPLPMVSEPTMSSSLDSVSDVYSLSPMSHSYAQGEDVSYVHSPTLLYDSYTNHSSPIPQSPVPAVLLDQRPPTSCPTSYVQSGQSNVGLSPNNIDSFEAQLSQKLLRECDALSVPELDAAYSTSSGSSPGPFWASPPGERRLCASKPTENPAAWPSVLGPWPVRMSNDVASRMPFFLDYYRNTMCPSMVFVDGPHNPFREHVLELATESASLRHAICALAACNLRMKRRLSLGTDTHTLAERLRVDKAAVDAFGASDGLALDDQALAEECEHRNYAVHLLNQQLHDAGAASHDAVLASILILCHYRMAESGIAKFRTQFAGVKKIMAMRRRQQLGVGSHPPPAASASSQSATWMEAIFTYFDAISASINDREPQLIPHTSLTGHESPLLPPGAEYLVGCDRGLFKIVSRLGRLNLLSQHRPVQKSPGQSHRQVHHNAATSLPRNIPSRSQSPLTAPIGHAYRGSLDSLQSQHQLGGMQGNLPALRFDGNGFVGTLNETEVLSSVTASAATYDDLRSTFWQEWKEARMALQGWEFDASRVLASLPFAATASQMRDLGSLSEAFRYAALLYTERLASPQAARSGANFQDLVSQVVYYATSLESSNGAEKFLLWPLFVAGCECTNELQQDMIRSKCREIMARSGYMNNLAALEVLEKVWRGGDSNDEDYNKLHAMQLGKSPFRWAHCMGGADADSEWIMF